MPVNPAFNTRSGGNQMLKFASTLCRIVNISASVIRARFSTRPALLAVLTAAELVCELLPAAYEEQAIMDAMSSEEFNPADETIIPGQES